MAELETDFPHLNPDDPTKDLWRIPRDDLQGDRPPGLIDLQRYPMGLGPSGIATFLQRPVALTPADLKAADVDVAMVGAALPVEPQPYTAAYLCRCARGPSVRRWSIAAFPASS
jgi:hypothetical protein